MTGKTCRLAIIGAGNLGGSIADQIVTCGFIKGQDLVLVDRNQARLKEYQQRLSCQISTDTQGIDANFVLLAVKPQDFPQLAERICFKNDTCIISVMAGVRVQSIASHLEQQRIVRTAPNLACRIAEGLTGIFSASNLKDDLTFATELFNKLGYAVEVQEEEHLDLFIAFASMPGFISEILQSYTSAVAELGFSAEQQRKMILQIFKGTILDLESSGLSFAEYQSKVASKGGTTAAGLKKLEENNLQNVLLSAVEAARKRAQELA